MKKLFLSYLLIFVFGFMFFFYEPIIMYSTNIADFSYDLYLILKPVFISFVLFLLLSCGFYTLIYLINEKYFPKRNIYSFCVLILLMFFIGFFIEGNFLTGGLPRLDGSYIVWSDYSKENIISIISWLLVFIVIIFSSIKYGISKIINKIPMVVSGVFLIFIVTLSITLVSTDDLFDKKNPAISLDKNYDLISNDKNFLILLLDSVDSVTFDEVVQKNGYSSIFNDFTYYKDITSAYLYTRDSIPYILSGNLNYNKKSFNDYSTEALNNSFLIKLLKEKKYNINIYSSSITWDSDEISNVSNLVSFERKLYLKNYLKEQKRFVLFKYLPFPLKFISGIDNLNFNRGKYNYDFDLYDLDFYDLGVFDWNDFNAYDFYSNKSLNKIDERIFKFIHLEGAHLPFNLDNKVSYVGDGNGTYYDKVESSILIIDSFLKQLKDNGVYDNSTIIIMSDHGYVIGNDSFGRQNPMFLVKGIDEHHEMIYSDLAVSYLDLNSLYTELINDEKGNDLFSDISPNRERKVLYYEYGKENHMIEYVQKGKAWDEKKLIPTGKEYKR